MLCPKITDLIIKQLGFHETLVFSDKRQQLKPDYFALVSSPVLTSVSGQRQMLLKMSHTHHHHLHRHCGRLYKYTWLEMHIAALTWYVKH